MSFKKEEYVRRIGALERLKRVLLSSQGALLSALKSDLNKHPFEAMLTEIEPSLLEIDHAVKNLKSWMKPRRIPWPGLQLFGTVCEQVPVPKGTVLILSTWNYPVFLSIAPLVNAIAAGNRITLGLHSAATETAKTLKSILDTAFDENWLKSEIFDANGFDELLTRPFDHVLYTGNEQAGRRVLASSVESMRSVTLELGGKSPAILFDDSQISQFVQRAVWAKFLNAGQTCLAPDYLLIPAVLKLQVLEGLKTQIQSQLGPESSFKTGDFGSLGKIVTSYHFDRLQKVFTEALDQGAELVFGGVFAKAKLSVSPSLLLNPSLKSRILKEELFGPLLPIVTFQNDEDLLRILRELPGCPLAFYGFGQKRSSADRALEILRPGSVCWNEMIIQASSPHLPFGGFKNSGLGKYRGLAGFNEFSYLRTEVRRSFGSFLLDLVVPPYTPDKMRRFQFFRKWL